MLIDLCCRGSEDGRAAVVHGATDLQDHHHQQVQEEARAADGLPQDVSCFFFNQTGADVTTTASSSSSVELGELESSQFFTC